MRIFWLFFSQNSSAVMSIAILEALTGWSFVRFFRS